MLQVRTQFTATSTRRTSAPTTASRALVGDKQAAREQRIGERIKAQLAAKYGR
jgi:hypothetical protein